MARQLAAGQTMYVFSLQTGSKKISLDQPPVQVAGPLADMHPQAFSVGI